MHAKNDSHLWCGRYVGNGILRTEGDPKFKKESEDFLNWCFPIYYWKQLLEKNDLQQKHGDSIMFHWLCSARRFFYGRYLYCLTI